MIMYYIFKLFNGVNNFFKLTRGYATKCWSIKTLNTQVLVINYLLVRNSKFDFYVSTKTCYTLEHVVTDRSTINVIMYLILCTYIIIYIVIEKNIKKIVYSLLLNENSQLVSRLENNKSWFCKKIDHPHGGFRNFLKII